MRFFQASVLCALGLLCGVVRAEFGNFYNFWEVTEDGIDLTRGNATNAKMIKGSKNIVINPARSAMIIVDMQSTSLIAVTCSIEVSTDADSQCISPPFFVKDFFLNPIYTGRPNSTGLAAVQPTIDAVRAFRAAGVKIIWCQVRPISSLLSCFERHNQMQFIYTVGSVRLRPHHDPSQLPVHLRQEWRPQHGARHRDGRLWRCGLWKEAHAGPVQHPDVRAPLGSVQRRSQGRDGRLLPQK